MLFFERDVEVYISTVDTGYTTNNTVKLTVLEGTSISYKTNSKNTYDYKLNGNNRLNEKVMIGYSNPEITLKTYVKPYNDTTNDTAVEKLLLYSLTGSLGTESPTEYSTGFISAYKLPELYIFIKSGNLIYKASNMVVKSAEYRFDINSVLTITWKLIGLTFARVTSIPGTFTDYTSVENYIAGNYTYIDIDISGIMGKLPVISGSIKLNNKINMANRDVLSVRGTQHLDHYIMDRSTELNCVGYLKTGTNSNYELFDTINTNLDYSTISVDITFGKTTEQHVLFELPNAHIELPKINFKDIISSNIKIMSKKSAVDNDDTVIKYNT